jgi:hypothetical protein
MKKIFFILLIILISGCALTYETPHKCELMQRGEPCLTNHACCNPPQTYYYQPSPNYYNWWWKVNKPTYTNYVIVKPNKPIYNGHRPTWNSNKPNKQNKKNKKR